MCVVIKIHDDQSEGLSRTTIISMVVTASGGTLSRDQAKRTWDKTILPFGQHIGLLTGYVKAQEGTSKRTAAGKIELQRDWHLVLNELMAKIKTKAMSVLQDENLVHEMLPWLLANLDEECLHALGKNDKVVGSRTKKKHDNQNASSRSFVTSNLLVRSFVTSNLLGSRTTIHFCHQHITTITPGC